MYTAIKALSTKVRRLSFRSRHHASASGSGIHHSTTTKTQATIQPRENKPLRVPTTSIEHGHRDSSACCVGIAFDGKMALGRYVIKATFKATKCVRPKYSSPIPKSHLSLSSIHLQCAPIVRPISASSGPIWTSEAASHSRVHSTYPEKKTSELLYTNCRLAQQQLKSNKARVFL